MPDKKKKNNSSNERSKELVENFNNATSKEKKEFVSALEKALNFNPKREVIK